jgi:AcrR family transcriptional regulator
VVLREAARQVGVSATAAYRHFAGHGELIQAVKEQAQGALARWMQAELEATPSQEDPAEDALRRLRALGAGYVRFALSEPGLFRTAFCHTEITQVDHPQIESFRSYQLLVEVLDDLVRCGRMPAHRREYAPVAAWSVAHGLALLLLDGPLSDIPKEQREALVRSALDTVIDGLCCPE